MRRRQFNSFLLATLGLAGVWAISQDASPSRLHLKSIFLPSSKVLLDPAPGRPASTNSLPTTVVISPDGKYLVALDDGFGTKESAYDQSITVLNISTNEMHDFPDKRFAKNALQTYFLGLGFSADGQRLYASVASLTDPNGRGTKSTGNGIAVYGFSGGNITPQSFIPIPPQRIKAGQHATVGEIAEGTAVPYPAGLAVITTREGQRLLVADNLSDDALLIEIPSGNILYRFDLTSGKQVPSSYPYGVVATADGKRGYCSLWNSSEVAELDLTSGQVLRRIPLLAPPIKTATGSHPTALLLSPDEKHLYVTLANRDLVAVIDTFSGKLAGLLSTRLPGQLQGGTYPNALAQSVDGSRLFAALAGSDAVALIDPARFTSLLPGVMDVEKSAGPAIGFIPTEWYPTAVAVAGNELFVASGKGKGTGPNGVHALETVGRATADHPYIAAMLHGSISRLKMSEIDAHLKEMTDEVRESNRMNAKDRSIKLPKNTIRHVIYIIKENRGYDQIFGDLGIGNADSSLCMYGEGVTPNQHRLARQFGVIDNFYDSGEVSGDGHVWSTAAISSDYTEKTWQISYRGDERSYDYEGRVSGAYPLQLGQADVNEPGTGYIWKNVASHGFSYRNYGEYVSSEWCDEVLAASPAEGPSGPQGGFCSRTEISPGQNLPAQLGNPKGGPSPWPWKIPIIARNVATKPELIDHFDPNFADFRLDYPDQLRADEFINEFNRFVEARKAGSGQQLPNFIIMRLPNDHTSGTRRGKPTPEASIADNDLALGRVVEAVSHSPYWEDTAIFVLEDDAQGAADHVDAHRSIALVISKYSPGTVETPFLDHSSYSTVNMIHTMEELLGLPPMNNNDAWADLMSPLFSASSRQPPYDADQRNLRNRLVFRTNRPTAPGAKESARMDFSHADAADSKRLNSILWHSRMGSRAVPVNGLRFPPTPAEGHGNK